MAIATTGTKRVHVSVSCREAGTSGAGTRPARFTRLTIRITDQGEGFEMQEVPDPLQDTNLLRHSGRGLFLMGAFMDDMKVRKLSARRAPK